MSLNTILATAPLTATGYHLKATGTALGQSLIWDNGTNVGIGNQGTTYGLEVTGTVGISGITKVLSSTASTSRTTGALVVTGGLGIGGALFGYDATFSQDINSLYGMAAARNGSNTQGSGPYFLLSNAAYSQLWYQQLNASNGLDYWYNGTKKMQIYSSGEVAIIGAAATEAAWGLLTNDANTGYFNIFAGGSGTATKGIILKTTTGSSTVNALTLASTGAATFSSDIAATKAYFTTTENAVNITSSSSASNVQLKVNNGTNGDIYAGVSASGGASVFTGTTAYSGYIGTNQATPFQIASSGIVRMTIASNGNIGAPSGSNIYNASDIRLKQNITTIVNGLDKIIALNPVKFNWIDGFEEPEDGKDMLGFVAQEVQNAIPEAVEGFGNNSVTIGETIIDNPLRVNEKFIIPVLVAAIKELNQTIISLQSQINELKNK